jgi:Protein of unknown function (DUF3179)
MRTTRIAVFAALTFLGCSPPPGAVETIGGKPIGMPATPMITRGLRTPPTQSAAAAKLADEAKVIGVVVNGKARAYSVKAMSSMPTHVVNDLIDDAPVTVTYCDQTDCVRAFTSEKVGSPLDLQVGGFHDELLLYDGKRFYRQENGQSENDSTVHIPYLSLPVERMTWGEWKKAHPDTNVFVGEEGSN